MQKTGNSLDVCELKQFFINFRSKNISEDILCFRNRNKCKVKPINYAYLYGLKKHNARKQYKSTGKKLVRSDEKLKFEIKSCKEIIFYRVKECLT